MTPAYWLFEAHLHILADEQQSDSHYDLIEGRFSAGTETPLHLHSKYDEAIYVLEGEFNVYTDTGTVTLKPGEHFFIPRDTPHVVASSSQPVNRSLTVASPSGFAKLIRMVGIPDIAEGIPPGQANDMGLFIQLSQETGDMILASSGARPTPKKW
jgi:quercetin dioxygenase-like cupin family protein